MRQVARDRGLEDAFLGELAGLDRSVKQALEADSREMVEAALGAVRAFAPQLVSTPVDVRRLAEHGCVPALERPSLLAAVQEAGDRDESSEGDGRPSGEAFAASGALLL